MVVQIEIPPECDEFGSVLIGSIRWAYRPVLEEKYSSNNQSALIGDCHVNINCSLGDDWQLVKGSVVHLDALENCTGVLINNTREDEKAYIFTAAHCVFTNNKYQAPVVYFNYESPTCIGEDGLKNHSRSGAILIATGDTLENTRDADSLDFALLELTNAPPDSFTPYFAGWYRGTTYATNTTTIHHPQSAVKKIAIDNESPQISLHDETYWDVNGLKRFSHWRILEWDTGTTEFGSSGCPLYNENQLVIGTLSGGTANCLIPKNDYFTRFDLAWDYYPEPWKQLKHWLDPENTGVMSLGGLPGYPVGFSKQAETDVNLKLYPNPAGRQVFIESGLAGGTKAEIGIFDITGKQHMRRSISWEGTARIDVSGFPSGMYVLVFRHGKGLTTRRFIISR